MLGFLRRPNRVKTEAAVKKTRQAWFGRMTSLFQGSRLDDGLWDGLEEALISADVGVTTSERLLERLRQRVRGERITAPMDALDTLKAEMVAMLDVDSGGGPPEVAELPLVVLMVGVNGSGKTTSLAKLAHLYKQENKRVLLGAADTFRAGAIEQLRAWGEHLDVEVIAHRAGADAGAVVFDTLQAARARQVDVVLIDTAGRLHTKFNLMEELKKLQRVVARQGPAQSQRVMLTLDATVGQNGLVQARSFVQSVACDGVFLAKLDGTAKGGIVLAVAEELNLPILYIGTGERPEDITSFDPRHFVDGLFDPLEAD